MIKCQLEKTYTRHIFTDQGYNINGESVLNSMYVTSEVKDIHDSVLI